MFIIYSRNHSYIHRKLKVEWSVCIPCLISQMSVTVENDFYVNMIKSRYRNQKELLAEERPEQ